MPPPVVSRILPRAGDARRTSAAANGNAGGGGGAGGAKNRKAAGDGDEEAWEAVSFVRVSDALNGMLREEAGRKGDGARRQLRLRMGRPAASGAGGSLSAQFAESGASSRAPDAPGFAISVFECSEYDCYRGDIRGGGDGRPGGSNDLRHLGIVSKKMRISSDEGDAHFTPRYREEDRRRKERRTVILPAGRGAKAGDPTAVPRASARGKALPERKATLDDFVYRMLRRKTYDDKTQLLESVVAELTRIGSPLREECSSETIARVLARVGEYRAPGRWYAKSSLPETCSPIEAPPPKAEAGARAAGPAADGSVEEGGGPVGEARGPAGGAGAGAKTEVPEAGWAAGAGGGAENRDGRAVTAEGAAAGHAAPEGGHSPTDERGASAEQAPPGKRAADKPLPKCLNFYSCVGIDEAALVAMEVDDKFEKDEQLRSEAEFMEAARYFDSRWKFYVNLDSWMLLARNELKALPHFDAFTMGERTDPGLSVRALAEAVRELKPLFSRARDLRNKYKARLGRMHHRLREFQTLGGGNEQ